MVSRVKKFFIYFAFIDLAILLLVLFAFLPQNYNEQLLAGLAVDADTGVADIGVVLGAGLKKGGAISDLAKERVDHALPIAKEQEISFVFSGGETQRGIEALSMNAYAKEQGYEGLDHIEASSHSTFENAKFTDELLDQDRFADDTVVVVTSPYHAKRAKAVFEATMPERTILIQFPEDSIVLVDTPMGRIRGGRALLREYLAQAWYKIRYGISL